MKCRPPQGPAPPLSCSSTSTVPSPSARSFLAGGRVHRRHVTGPLRGGVPHPPTLVGFLRITSRTRHGSSSRRAGSHIGRGLQAPERRTDRRTDRSLGHGEGPPGRARSPRRSCPIGGIGRAHGGVRAPGRDNPESPADTPVEPRVGASGRPVRTDGRSGPTGKHPDPPGRQRSGTGPPGAVDILEASQGRRPTALPRAVAHGCRAPDRPGPDRPPRPRRRLPRRRRTRRAWAAAFTGRPAHGTRPPRCRGRRRSVRGRGRGPAGRRRRGAPLQGDEPADRRAPPAGRRCRGPGGRARGCTPCRSRWSAPEWGTAPTDRPRRAP